MSNRDPSFDAYVLKIHGVLDRLDYYRILGVERTAGVSDIRKAFYGIAAKFHPDRNRSAEKTVQKAIYDIFKRLNEAYRVLCDPDHRRLYDEQLAQGKTRLEQDIRRTSIPRNPEDTMRSREARQFYLQAVQELKAGNLMKAELNIKVSQGKEPGNAAIEALIQDIKTAKAEKKKS